MKPLMGIAFVAAVAFSASPAAADSPTLTWNRIAREAVERSKPTQHQAARLLAHVSIAQYAAATGAGSEALARDAIAAASMQVIAELAPSQAAYAEQRYRELHSRTSVEGRVVAQRVLAEAGQDGFVQKWAGQAPQAEYSWRSLANPPAPPAYPAIGGMRTLLVESASAFRAGPPPAIGSQRFLDDLAELRRYTQSPTEETTRIAKFYDMTTGTMAAGFWNEQAAALLARDTRGEQQAAVVLVTVNAAMLDALAACHDSKYVYWVPRPSQADPSIKPLIGVPNHPAYPSNHACLSTAAGSVLAHFFPQESERLKRMAAEAGLSRIYAGIHYRFDVEAGEEIGRQIAASAVARHHELLARWSRVQVAGE